MSEIRSARASVGGMGSASRVKRVSRVGLATFCFGLATTAGLTGCRRATEAAADTATEAAFMALQKYACEDKAEALLQRIDHQKLRENQAKRGTAKSGDVVTLVVALAAQAAENLKHGDLSLFCTAKDVEVDEKTQTVTWTSGDGKAMFARFERADGELKVVDIGVSER